MPLTLTDEEINTLKKAFKYQLISHKAYFNNSVLFHAMKDSGDFEKVVVEPLMPILKWTAEDEAEAKRAYNELLEKAQAGKTAEEWYKSALKALDKEFKITGKDIAVVAGGAAAIGTALLIGGKLIKAISKGKGKKKTGE